jgi:hypothetical protein
MYNCNCGKIFEKRRSLNSHARFCKKYIKIDKKSKYLKNEFYVCECDKSFDNHQSLNAHFSYCLIHRNNKPISRNNSSWKEKCLGWNKGLTKETDARIAKYGLTHSNKMKTGEITPSFKGKYHSIQSRQKMSNSANEKNNGFIKCKYFEVFCKYENKMIKVQGSWEKRLTEILDGLNILWIKDRSKSIKYSLDNITRNYYPDFYLPERNEFIEVKGHWFKSPDGRVDDLRKMNLVISQNPNLKIIILTSIKEIENFK